MISRCCMHLRSCSKVLLQALKAAPDSSAYRLKLCDMRPPKSRAVGCPGGFFSSLLSGQRLPPAVQRWRPDLC